MLRVGTESNFHLERCELEDDELGDYYCRCSHSRGHGQASSHYATPVLLYLGTPWFLLHDLRD